MRDRAAGDCRRRWSCRRWRRWRWWGGGSRGGRRVGTSCWTRIGRGRSRSCWGRGSHGSGRWGGRGGAGGGGWRGRGGGGGPWEGGWGGGGGGGGVGWGPPAALGGRVSGRVLRPWRYRVMGGHLGLPDDTWSFVVQVAGLVTAFFMGLAGGRRRWS